MITYKTKPVAELVNDSDCGYYANTSYRLYDESDMGDSHFQLNINSPHENIRILFRRVKRRECALQVTIESYKEDRAGRMRTTSNSFSLPEEMIPAFITALQTIK